MVKALYRQYRPQTFDQVLGQDRVVNVLKNQVQTGMISHAYLFAGERGCGKTTCAKIFAKAINCKNPNNGSPCLVCENCKSIDSETSMDVVEMDAASNRKIDDIRQIKETVMYPPNNLKYKVYIIDEAHMITREAFNALLKMMEEPPSHLVFILATTEIDKIPKTILSRVQKFEFNKIDKSSIKKQIDIILEDLNIKIESDAIELIIKKAQGAMRDALSILDQVVSSSKDYYSLKDVENILGLVSFDKIYDIANNINNYDKKKVLEEVFSLRKTSKANMDILDGLTNFYREVLIYKSTNSNSFFDSKERFEYIDKFSKTIDNNRLIDSLEILADYSNKLKYSDNTDLVLELSLIRLIDYKDLESLESRIRNLEQKDQESLVDIIDSLIDKRLKNYDISNNISREKETKKEIKKDLSTNVVKQEKNIEREIPKDTLINKKSEKKKNDIVKQNFGLEKSIEEKIEEEIGKVAGPLVKMMFKSDGFNYKFDNKVFFLYYKDSMYQTILDSKIKEIEKIIKNFTNDDIQVKIINEKEKVNFEDKKESPIKSRDENKTINILNNLFGDELIIE